MTDENRNKVICDSKLDFTTIQAVQSHIKQLNKIGILDFYKCKICDNYHTATMKDKSIVSQKREHSRQKRTTTENRIKKMR